MKTDARKLSPATQEQIRRKAVAAVEKGMTRVKVAEVFGVTRHSVDRWVKAYRASGPDALKVRKRGPKGERAKLKDGRPPLPRAPPHSFSEQEPIKAGETCASRVPTQEIGLSRASFPVHVDQNIARDSDSCTINQEC